MKIRVEDVWFQTTNRCPKCGEKWGGVQEFNINDLASSGWPICGSCGADLEVDDHVTSIRFTGD
jgi:predicted RNA-binding Zn-ribbon protein involved in translation (DUF1610 family)